MSRDNTVNHRRIFHKTTGCYALSRYRHILSSLSALTLLFFLAFFGGILSLFSDDGQPSQVCLRLGRLALRVQLLIVLARLLLLNHLPAVTDKRVETSLDKKEISVWQLTESIGNRKRYTIQGRIDLMRATST